MAANLTYDGDVAFKYTPDGGVIEYVNGQPLMDTGGLENAVVISLFSGVNWPGNALHANDPRRRIGSDFESHIGGKPLTTNALIDIERAAGDALQWFVDEGVAKSITPVATAPSRNRVNLEIFVERPDGMPPESFKFELNWIASIAAGAIHTGVS